MKRWKKWGVRSAALWGLAVLFAGVLGWAGGPVYGASVGGQGTGIGGEQAPGRGMGRQRGAGGRDRGGPGFAGHGTSG
ncbi:MAG: hypothetical protein ACLTCQ_04270 [Enterocloster bolteae]